MYNRIRLHDISTFTLPHRQYMSYYAPNSFGCCNSFANPFMMPSHCNNNIWNTLFAFNIMNRMVNNMFAYQKMRKMQTNTVSQPVEQPITFQTTSIVQPTINFDSNDYLSLNTTPAFDYSSYFKSICGENTTSTKTPANTTSTTATNTEGSTNTPSNTKSKSTTSSNTATINTKSNTSKKIVLQKTEIVAIACRMAKKYNVDERLVLAMINQESSFTNGKTSTKGAKGLMQLMPATAKAMGVKDINDPEQNIEGGVKYLRKLLDKYNGNVKLALAAYNAGAGNVDKYGGIPPFKETQNYVKKIYDTYQNYEVA